MAEDVNGQVGYVPAAYVMIILDETLHEEESRKEAHEQRTDATNIGGEMGLDGERRNTYSAAVIDGCERTSTIYVGDTIVRKTDTRVCKGKDVVVCLPGARIEHVIERESREDHGKRKGRNHSGSRRDELRGKAGTTAIVDKYSNLLKKTKGAIVGPVASRRNRGPINNISFGAPIWAVTNHRVVFRILRVFRIV